MKLTSTLLAFVLSAAAVSAHSLANARGLSALSFNANANVLASAQTGVTCTSGGSSSVSAGASLSWTLAGTTGVGVGSGGVCSGVPTVVSGLHVSLTSACAPLLCALPPTTHLSPC
jgi:hypothetical protein